TGRLLVASPALRDSVFDWTVVLVLEHNEDGAIGLVLNRPSETPVAEIRPEWAPMAASPDVVFIGGPVSPSSAICLARAGPAADNPTTEGWKPLFGHLGTLDLGLSPADVTVVIESL